MITRVDFTAAVRDTLAHLEFKPDSIEEENPGQFRIRYAEDGVVFFVQVSEMPSIGACPGSGQRVPLDTKSAEKRHAVCPGCSLGLTVRPAVEGKNNVASIPSHSRPMIERDVFMDLSRRRDEFREKVDTADIETKRLLWRLIRALDEVGGNFNAGSARRVGGAWAALQR
jgi:hypothetical protein